jgi:phospho-N-acetylmuramoyl-pentapeptide-transferase
MGLVIGMGAVGFVDDYLGVRARRNLGLRKRGKFVGQAVVALAFALVALAYVDVSTHLSFTRDLDLDLGNVGWLLWAVFVILSMANAVNFADGADGLAAGSGALVFSAFVIIGFWEFRHESVYGILPAQAVDLATIAAALVGACAGFLWWNAAPAQIFMGDTGALAIGGGLAGLALLTRTHLLLPIIGGLYLVEMFSVIAQVISFRLFGRRVLRMAPIHHHFEQLGWPEFTVIVRFWLFTGITVALGVGLFYADFIRIPGAID